MAAAQRRFVTRVNAIPKNLQLQVPALAESGFDPPVCVAIIADLALGVVPQKLPLVVRRHCSEHEPFGIRPCNAEVRASWSATLAGSHPVAGVSGSIVARARAWRPLQIGVWQLVFSPAGAGKKADPFAATACTQAPLRSHEHEVVAAGCRLSAAASGRWTATSGIGGTSSRKSTASSGANLWTLPWDL